MDVSGLRRALVAFVTAGLVALGVSASASTAVSAAATVTPVTSGLDNPRGLSFGPNGRLYVAEAGNGGEEACLPPEHTGEEAFCIGFTGGIGAIDVSSGNHRRVVSNLVSFAGKEGFAATGVDYRKPETQKIAAEYAKRSVGRRHRLCGSSKLTPADSGGRSPTSATSTSGGRKNISKNSALNSRPTRTPTACSPPAGNGGSPTRPPTSSTKCARTDR